MNPSRLAVFEGSAIALVASLAAVACSAPAESTAVQSSSVIVAPPATFACAPKQIWCNDEGEGPTQAQCEVIAGCEWSDVSTSCLPLPCPAITATAEECTANPQCEATCIPLTCDDIGCFSGSIPDGCGGSLQCPRRPREKCPLSSSGASE
jgi:hypothetical protein